MRGVYLTFVFLLLSGLCPCSAIGQSENKPLIEIGLLDIEDGTLKFKLSTSSTEPVAVGMMSCSYFAQYAIKDDVGLTWGQPICTANVCLPVFVRSNIGRIRLLHKIITWANA